MKFYLLNALPLTVFALALAANAHAETAEQVLGYKSAFEGYQAYSPSELKNWPKANQLVGEIGGWRVYAREPSENEAPEKEAPQPAVVQPAPHQHGDAR